MILPKEFLTRAQTRDLRCTANEGAFWAHGHFWLARGSPFSPAPRRHVLLLACYTEPRPTPPAPEAVESLLAAIGEIVPATERDAFAVQAAILRATAREYHAF